MPKYDIDNLYLEITRNCTLECAHCFRGPRQNINMSIETIDKVFDEIEHIDFLLITGGEPFLAINELNEVIKKIEENKISINRCMLVTNGTILNSEIIKIIKFFMLNSNFELTISNDKFHLMELERLGLRKTREKNVKTLSELFDIKLSKDNDGLTHMFYKIGNATKLTKMDLDYINSWGEYKSQYTIGEDFFTKHARLRYDKPVVDGNKIYNYLYVDANGNFAPIYYSYEDADNLTYGSVNNDLSLGENLIKKL